MASSVANRQPCPLIKDFLRSIGKDVDKSPSVTNLKASVDDEEQVVGELELDGTALDNPHWSNLTRTQHARYLTLISSSQKLNQSQKRELQALKKQVKLERRTYMQATIKFWLASREKLKCGFYVGSPSFPFVQLVTATEKVLHGWTKTLPQLRFGDSVQLISCEADSLFPSNWLDMTSSRRIATVPLNGEIKYNGSILMELPLPGSNLATPSQRESDYTPFLLQHDKTAMDLATLHKADIVTCIETLETLLQAPLERSSTFIPCCRVSNGTLVLEPPVPHGFSSPRHCLTVAYKEGLFQWLEAIGMKQSDFSKQFEYRLVTLPNFRNKGCKVIVRIPDRLVYKSGDVEQSLLVRSQIEYFPERGEEVPGALEKSIWILDHILGMSCPSSNKRKVMVASIDPFAGRLMQWRDVSLAHALAEDDLALDHTKSPLQSVRNLLCLLHSITSLGRGDLLLCYPSQASGKVSEQYPAAGESRKFEFISVHKAQGEDINLADLLNNAGNVASSAAALERCCRFWRWTNENQVPYTFPVESVDSSNAMERQH